MNHTGTMVTATAVALPVEMTWARHDRFEREIASATFADIAQAVAWLDKHIEQWRASLKEHEALFETWVHGPTGRVELHARHGREVGADMVMFVREDGRT